MKLRTVTLGCKVNQYETEYVREGLLGIGYQDAQDDEAAELCIVNTFTVTAEGDAKSRHTIRRLARRNPGAKIVVMGCYATRAPNEVAALPGVSQVVTDKRELPDLLGRFGVTDIPTGISGFGRRHRAYVKVQDGCMLRCSFCIIPYVRPLAQATAEIPQEQIIKAATLGASTWQMIVRVVLPQIMPRLITAIRLGLVPAWIFLISAEAIASTDGLGYRIFLVRRYLAMDVILPYVAWITLIAFTLDRLLYLYSRRRYHWAHIEGGAI
jgi:hypothetical protein